MSIEICDYRGRVFCLMRDRSRTCGSSASLDATSQQACGQGRRKHRRTGQRIHCRAFMHAESPLFLALVALHACATAGATGVRRRCGGAPFASRAPLLSEATATCGEPCSNGAGAPAPFVPAAAPSWPPPSLAISSASSSSSAGSQTPANRLSSRSGSGLGGATGGPARSWAGAAAAGAGCAAAARPSATTEASSPVREPYMAQAKSVTGCSGAAAVWLMRLSAAGLILGAAATTKRAGVAGALHKIG